MHQRFYELIQEIRDMPLAHRLKDIAIPAHITLLLTSALMEEENAGLNDDDMLLFATIRAYALNNLDKELGTPGACRGLLHQCFQIKIRFQKNLRRVVAVVCKTFAA